LCVFGGFCKLICTERYFLFFNSIAMSAQNTWKDDKWEFYKDNQDEWRWKRFATNGEQVGSAHEGYKNRSDCVVNAMRAGYEE
jgi:uncharacterized protein YegP (UPF0339 family)